MPHYMYVAVSGDDQISVFTVDADNGGMTHKHDVSVPGGPFTLAISPDRNHLYCGTREAPGLTSFRIDQSGGGLTQTGSAPLDSWPVYVNTDRRGRFLLSSYYQGAKVAVHPIGDDGSVGGPPVVSLETATGAHAMQTDPTNRYAFVPHIAGNGPNQVWQFLFDEDTGRITPNDPAIVEPEEFLGPRHFCFHPSLDVLYFSNEQGCSVSGYRLDTSRGTLSLFQTITTLPPEGFAERNTCSQIQITGSGRFLYAPEPGPRQYRLLHRGHGNGRTDRQRNRRLGSAAQRAVPWSRRPLHLLSGTGLGTDGHLPGGPGVGRAGPVGNCSAG